MKGVPKNLIQNFIFKISTDESIIVIVDFNERTEFVELVMHDVIWIIYSIVHYKFKKFTAHETLTFEIVVF